MVAAGGGVLGGGVTEAVLGAQLLGNLTVDLGYVLILLDLEEAAAGLLGHALEVFLAVDMARASGISASIGVAARTAAGIASAGIASTRVPAAGVAAAGITSSWIASARISSAWITAARARSTAATAGWVAAAVAGIILVRLLALEVDSVDDGVGALGGLHRF